MQKAYRGYLIRQTFGGETFITKDGQHIGYAKDEADARAIIDMLCGDA
jgi:hypothetical protein